MKMSMLRRLDRCLGIPLTAILTLIRKSVGWMYSPPEDGASGILFLKLAEQGSTVLAYGAICRAVEMVGRDRVYFLAFDNNRFIVDVLDVIPEENVITINESTLLVAVFSSLRAIARMRGLPIDSAIDMEFFARSSAIFAYLSGARRRVGLHRYAGGGAYRGDLMTHRLIYNPHLHTSQVFYTMVDALNYPSADFPCFGLQVPALNEFPLASFSPKPEDVTATTAIILDCTDLEKVPPLILLNANCSDLLPLRRWDTGNYIQLALRLLERYEDLYIGLTGSPSEMESVEGVVREVDSHRCVNFAGRTTMDQLLTLYSLSRVLITNDSGPAHFATLTPIQTISLFGPETPTLFAAYSPRSHAMWAGLACSPCVSAYNNRVSTCQNNLCMKRISIDEVFEKTCELFENDPTESKRG